MEVSLGHKRKQQEFSLVSISHLSPSSSSTSPSPPVVACFSADSLELRFQQDSDSSDVIKFDLQAAQVCIFFPSFHFRLAHSKAKQMKRKSWALCFLVKYIRGYHTFFFLSFISNQTGGKCTTICLVFLLIMDFLMLCLFLFLFSFSFWGCNNFRKIVDWIVINCTGIWILSLFSSGIQVRPRPICLHIWRFWSCKRGIAFYE